MAYPMYITSFLFQLHQEMKETLHTGHLGIDERCKRRTRDILYWPGINAHLEDYVAS